MSEQSAFPLAWPAGRPRTPRHAVQRSAFGKHSLAEARDELLRQIGLLRVSGVVLSTNIPLRRDGLPRADWRQPADTGVAVYFRLKGRAMAMASDRWHSVEHNLWALAKTIEAQRGVTRWGAVEVEQAFAGYAALPAPGNLPAESCWTTLGIPAGSSLDAIESAFRERAKSAHPDRGGTSEEMQRLNHARFQARVTTATNGGAR